MTHEQRDHVLRLAQSIATCCERRAAAEPGSMLGAAWLAGMAAAERWRRNGGRTFGNFVGQAIWLQLLPGAVENTASLDALSDRADESAQEPGHRLEVADEVRHAMARMTERERAVVDMIDGRGMSLAEVGKVFGLTRERIRQIRLRGIRRTHGQT